MIDESCPRKIRKNISNEANNNVSKSSSYGLYRKRSKEYER